MLPQAWEVDAHRQGRVAQQIVLAARGVFAGVLRVDGERHLPGEEQAAGDRGLLIGRVPRRGRIGALSAGGVDEGVEKLPNRGAAT